MKLRFLIPAILVVLAIALPACGQGVLMQLPPIVNSQGQPLAGVTVSVFQASGTLPNLVCGTPVKVTEDQALNIPFNATNTNQVTTDGFGNFPFWIAPATNPYGYTVSGTNINSSVCYGFTAMGGSGTFTAITGNSLSLVGSALVGGNLTVTGATALNGGMSSTTGSFTGSVGIGGGTTGAPTGNLNIGGGTPWFDVTAPPWNAKCDGSTDDTAAFQAALTAANAAKGGVVYVPNKTTTCKIAGQLVLDQFTNVIFRGDVNGNGQGQAIASRPLLLFTGTTSPAISIRSATSVTVSNLMIELSNSGFNGGVGGMIIDTEHVTASDSVGLAFRDLNINGGAAAANVACGICLDKTVVTTVERVNFTNMVGAIRGRVNISSYSTANLINYNYFDISTGTITGGFIQNPGVGWAITNNDFEVTGGVYILDETGGGCAGCNFSGNHIGDISGSYNGTLFKNIACDGSAMTGNEYAGGGTNTNFMSFVSGGGCWLIAGNTFNNTWGTLYTNGSGNTQNMTIVSNVYGTITTFGLGQFASGQIVDNTGAVTVDGQPWNFGFNSSLSSRTGLNIGAGQVLLISGTAPTITGAGCGGSGATIASNNGTAAFTINVGSTPGSACTVTMPTATTGWACSAVDVTTNSTSVFVQKQSPAASQTATQIVITNFNDIAAATAFTGSDVVRVSCQGY